MELAHLFLLILCVCMLLLIWLMFIRQCKLERHINAIDNQLQRWAMRGKRRNYELDGDLIRRANFR